VLGHMKNQQRGEGLGEGQQTCSSISVRVSVRGGGKFQGCSASVDLVATECLSFITLTHACLFYSDDRLPYGIIDVSKSPKTLLSSSRESSNFSVSSIKLICVLMQINIRISLTEIKSVF
jgi:hypothetical protein